MTTISIFRGRWRWLSWRRPSRPAIAALTLAVGVLAIAMWLVVSDPLGPASTVTKQPAREKQAPAPAAAEPQRYAGSQNAAADQGPPAIVDVFALRTWQPPAPPASAQAEAGTLSAPPQAPPLPFRLIGRFMEPGAAPVFLLAEGETVLPVRIGDRIGDNYRVEKLDKGQLVFRYRPLNTVQTLAVGDVR